MVEECVVEELEVGVVGADDGDGNDEEEEDEEGEGEEEGGSAGAEVDNSVEDEGVGEVGRKA